MTHAQAAKPQPAQGKPAPAPPSAFCSEPHALVQRAWDSHSLAAFRECPRKYQYMILEGWRANRMKPSLSFGIYLHRAMEVIHHAKAAGKSHEDVMLEALDWALLNTGSYVQECPYCKAKVANVDPHDEPQKCPSCKESMDPPFWVPYSTSESTRNIVTLSRAIIWYCEQFENDPVRTVVLENGRAAVEHSFRLALPLPTPEGDSYILCGHIDALGLYGADDDLFVKEHKHTVSSFSKNYFDRFTPNTQITCYSFSSRVALDEPAKGVMIDAIQIGVNFVRFQRQFAYRTPDILEEWIKDTMYWIKQAEDCAAEDYWPMNDMSCDKYGGCHFRSICGKSPGVREKFLSGDFHRDYWNPLKNRDV